MLATNVEHVANFAGKNAPQQYNLFFGNIWVAAQTCHSYMIRLAHGIVW